MNRLLGIRNGVWAAVAALCAVAAPPVAAAPVPVWCSSLPPLVIPVTPAPVARAQSPDDEMPADLRRAVDVLLKSPADPPAPTPLPPLMVDPPAPPPAAPPSDAPVQPAGCKACGTGLPGGPSLDLLTADPGSCYPGQYNTASGAVPSHAVGRFLYGVYNCLCVPDPCYEPKWIPLADTAFFTPSARPVTQTRFRGGLVRGLGTPDRAEWFWPKGVGADRGPRSADGRRVRFVDDDRLTMYTEAATGSFGFYTELTYHRVRPDAGPGASGFGDLTIGTKALVHDCELFQIAIQMETVIPTANSIKGLGTGHTTLEPSVILGLKLSHDMFLQAQVAEWIPIGGDPGFAGSALRYNFALNKVLCRPLPDCPLIGTLELTGITFQDGAFTDPATGAAVRGSGVSYLSIGPGLRQFICDRVDFGIGSTFGVGSLAGPRQEYRIDLRVRY